MRTRARRGGARLSAEHSPKALQACKLQLLHQTSHLTKCFDYFVELQGSRTAAGKVREADAGGAGLCGALRGACPPPGVGGGPQCACKQAKWPRRDGNSGQHQSIVTTAGQRLQASACARRCHHGRAPLCVP